MASLWKPIQTSLPQDPLDFGDLPSLVKKFLAARGFQNFQEVQNWLNPKLADLKNPFSILGMTEATRRLVEAFKKQETIALYADFDLDGTPGLALLTDGLKQLGYKNIIPFQPKRLVDGYGFHPHLVQELHQQNVSLIVTIDVGITAFSAVEKAKELGVDVIITDHHQTAETLPEALAVVNPNRKDCQSGLGYLCGAGVAFYLLRALKRALLDEKLISESQLDLKSVLDCFCIGTLTDMVPLIEDNRILVKQGLLQLEKTKRPGLKMLLLELDLLGRPLTGQDVAIRFAPKLNALSRLELGMKPIDLFFVETESEAQKMVSTVLSNNSTRVQLQAEGDQEALEQMKTWPHKKFIFLSSAKFHRGVVGLIATKLAGLFNVPTFIGSVGEDGQVVGSGRLPPGSDQSLLAYFEAISTLLDRFGGHEAAAGFEFKISEQEKIIQGLADFFSQETLSPAPRATYFDLEAGLHEVNETLLRWFDVMGPFGQGFASPVFLIRNLNVLDIIELRGGHLRYRLAHKMEAIYFSPPPEAKSFKNQKIDILCELQWNYFAGAKKVQIMVKQIRAAVVEDALNESQQDAGV